MYLNHISQYISQSKDAMIMNIDGLILARGKEILISQFDINTFICFITLDVY